MTRPKLMLLHGEDNVVICIAPIAAGESLEVGRAQLRAAQDIGVGHKLAFRAIASGEKILKYGAPIGSATQAIAPGVWVHLHNMKSDYIASHDRQTVQGAAA
jgi:D-threo-aldose 1-dehydrogenase